MVWEHEDGQGDTRRVPFWLHQLVELLLGMLLLVQGARTGEHTAVLVALGAVLVALALFTDGALGAWPWIGRRLHRVLDIVAAATVALSPVVLDLDRVLAVVVLEAAAAALVWLTLRTDWRAPHRRMQKSSRRREAGPASRRAPEPAPPSEPAPAPLARTLGAAAGRLRDEGPRTLGRWVGRARGVTRAEAPDISRTSDTPDTPDTPGAFDDPGRPAA